MHLIGPIRRWLADRYGWRYVLVTSKEPGYVPASRLLRAYHTESGWIVWYSCVMALTLEPDGTIKPWDDNRVMTWRPVYGWSKPQPYDSPAEALRELVAMEKKGR